MTEHQSSRTLVKSAPELWAECSDAASLARHLGAFGEIRITKLEPETAVAWEGAAASGTVRLESSGWGTRVTLTVREEERPVELVEPVATEPEPLAVEPEPVDVVPEPEPIPTEPEPEPVAMEPVDVEPEPEPVAEALELEPARRAGRFARFRLAFRRRAAPPGEPLEPEPERVAEEPKPVAEEPEPMAEPEPIPVAEAPAEPEAVAEPEPAPEPPAPVEAAAPGGEEALVAALDSLGMAHHRPYSRA
jgi:hypothetical protein